VNPLAQFKQKEFEKGAVHSEQLTSQLKQEFKEL
jgi:hypothetical protein